MEEKLERYFSKHSIEGEGRVELLKIFNESLLEIGEGILRTKKDSIEKRELTKKFASKKAEEYAIENNLSLDDFDIEKIGKSDVEKKIRDKIKENKTTSPSTSETSSKKSKVKKDKVICKGITQKGEPCNRVATYKPDGAKNMYCFRHHEDWKTYETDDDSSEEEEEKVERVERVERVVSNKGKEVCSICSDEEREKESDDDSD